MIETIYIEEQIKNHQRTKEILSKRGTPESFEKNPRKQQNQKEHQQRKASLTINSDEINEFPHLRWLLKKDNGFSEYAVSNQSVSIARSTASWLMSTP